MTRLLDGWRLATGTLTVLPIGAPQRVDPATAGTAMLCAPLAVLPLGAAAAGIMLAGNVVGLAPLITGLLVVGALALGSRCLHLDGLSDTVDGLTASYDRDRSLQVMKSGTIGPAGAVALIVALGLQAAALATLATGAGGALLAGVAVVASRGALAASCLRGLASARPDGLGGTYAGSVPRAGAAVVWLLAALALAAAAGYAGLPSWRGALAAAVALAVVAVLLRRVVRRLGGVTGDVYGASVEVALTAMLVALG